MAVCPRSSSVSFPIALPLFLITHILAEVFFFEWPLYEANLDTEIEDLTNAINGTI